MPVGTPPNRPPPPAHPRHHCAHRSLSRASVPGLRRFSAPFEPPLVFPLPTAHCPLPTAHCPLPTAHCPLPTAHCPLPTAHCPLPTAHCPLPAARCPLPAARCPLPAARCPLPAARCPLPAAHCSTAHCSTAHCPLPTAHCPLPTAHCPLPTARVGCRLPSCGPAHIASFKVSAQGQVCSLSPKGASDSAQGAARNEQALGSPAQKSPGKQTHRSVTSRRAPAAFATRPATPLRRRHPSLPSHDSLP